VSLTIELSVANRSIGAAPRPFVVALPESWHAKYVHLVSAGVQTPMKTIVVNPSNRAHDLLPITLSLQQQKGWAIDVLSALARPREGTTRVKSVVE
jgi:hypothetical protein